MRPPRRSAIAEPRDRDLVRLYWPPGLRDAFDALLAIDDAMADVLGKATEPALAAIKLAWWRERLEELDAGKLPAEPRLRAAAEQLLARGIGGRSLAEIEEGWALVNARGPGWHEQSAAQRGRCLFALGAQLLGIPMEPALEQAGLAFAAVDLARRGLAPHGKVALPSVRFPRAARPLTLLAALAARDMRRGGEPFEPEATPARAWTLLRHRLTGRLH